MNTEDAKQANDVLVELMKKHGLEPTPANVVEVLKGGSRGGAMSDVAILAVAVQGC
jgi:hypothetical protein